MNTIIYYFTGTGNSLAAARKLARDLGDCELVPIALLEEHHEEIHHQDERIGIVCPVYHARLPCIVAEFAERLAISFSPYVFAVITAGGGGAPAIRQLTHILYRRTGRHLDAAWTVKMPGNRPSVISKTPRSGHRELLEAADARLAKITRMIEAGVVCPPEFPPLSLLLLEIAGNGSCRNVHNTDRDFSVTGSCTACRICVRVCPVDNIIMIRDKPSWLHHCESCCACLNFCPEEAIRLNGLRGTLGRGRYHHPEVTVEDMALRESCLQGTRSCWMDRYSKRAREKNSGRSSA